MAARGHPGVAQSASLTFHREQRQGQTYQRQLVQVEIVSVKRLFKSWSYFTPFTASSVRVKHISVNCCKYTEKKINPKLFPHAPQGPIFSFHLGISLVQCARGPNFGLLWHLMKLKQEKVRRNVGDVDIDGDDDDIWQLRHSNKQLTKPQKQL